MRIHTLRRTQELDGTPQEVFPFFADAFNLEAIFDFRRDALGPLLAESLRRPEPLRDRRTRG